VLANNPSVAEQLKEYKTAIETYLRGHLDNDNVTMSIRVRAAEEKKRAYSRQEQFMNMCGMNPSLKKTQIWRTPGGNARSMQLWRHVPGCSGFPKALRMTPGTSWIQPLTSHPA
jgi:hypothetical protein